MTAPHLGTAQLDAFLDGELDAAQADAARLHLATCVECQRKLEAAMQLELLVSDAVNPPASTDTAPPPNVIRPSSPRWTRFVTPVVGLALAAGLATILIPRLIAPPPAATVDPTTLSLTGERGIEGRVSWAQGDVWRPLGTVRGKGATPSDPVPLTTMAALEKKGDPSALAAAWLLNGNAGHAKALLQKLDATADVSSDLAAVALQQGFPDEAIEYAQAALDLNPKHSRALWNKALAAQRLGFGAVAAANFAKVAQLGEKGWAEEAKGYAMALDAQRTRQIATYQRALDAAGAMIFQGTPMPNDLVLAAPSTARVYLTYALRTVPSKEGALALLPVAEKLNDPNAVAEVKRAADADFAKRKKLQPQLRAFFAGFFKTMATWAPFAPHVDPSEAVLTPEQTTALVSTLLKEKRADDLLLLLPMTSSVGAHFEAYASAANASQDPWFTAALQLEKGNRALAAGNAAEAERLWLEVPTALKGSVRALQAFEKLALQYNVQHRAAEAQAMARTALELAREQGELNYLLRLFATYGDAARFRNLEGLSMAALEERALWQPEACEPHLYFEEAVATLAELQLEPKLARAALQRATSCGDPLTVVGLLSFADLIRYDPQPGDLEKLQAMLGAYRKAESTTDAQRIQADHIEGRALIDSQPTEGLALLEKASRDAAKGDDPTLAKKISAYGHGIARIDAAKHQAFAQIFSLTADEIGHPLPEGCALIVEVQGDRVAVAGRDPKGQITGAYTAVARTHHHREGLETQEIAAVVAPVARQAGLGCTAVQVYAGFPLHGRGGWLPDELPWSYATGLTPRAAINGRWLVVSDVDTPASLGLPKLSAWSSNAPGVTVADTLTGAQATPERVLSALSDASFAEFDAHGLVNTGDDDIAAIALAPGINGYTLSAARVAKASFPHHPVVLLGACRAATVAPYLHEAWSLPRAFAQAGARAVIAAPVDLPDTEAREFFGRLTARLAKGEAAVSALRDERVAWLREGKAGWVRSVLVFD